MIDSRMATPLPIGKGFNSETDVVQEIRKCSSSSSTSNIGFSRKNYSPFLSNDKILSRTRKKANKRISLSLSRDSNQCVQISRTEGSPLMCKEVFSSVFYASESDSTEKHKNSLEMYMENLRSQAKQISGSDNVSDMDDPSSQLQARKELGLLEEYLSTLREEAKSKQSLPSNYGRNASGKLGDSSIIRKKSNIYARKAASSAFTYDEKESGNLYLISTLLSINIAVFLFEIASPVKNSDYNLNTLPMLYGAKVNGLIMVGEWWRLVTPMFLHSGLMHIALSSWVLLSFGPQVCKRYGSFTFLLIFILGGLSGNLSSFIHTSEPTVGGSGPIFAVIGAWLVYQARNKDVIPKELSDSMFQKAIVATALSFVLVTFGPMENWTSLGAAVSGIIYGFCTCPVAQVDDALQETNGGMKEEMTLNSTQAANPCKSLLIFTVFATAITSVLFLVESPFDSLEFEELVQIIE